MGSSARRGVLIGLIATLLVCSAVAQTPTSPAILKVETGLHVGRLEHAAFSVDGRTLVTSSSDKTTRIWDAEQGRMVGVLRTPIGVGGDGATRALAVHPTGQYVAVAVNGRPSLFIFSRDQRLIRSFAISGIGALRFREDGVLLIAESDKLSSIDVTTGAQRPLAAITTDRFVVAGGRVAAIVGESEQGVEVKLCDGGGAGPCRTAYTALVGHTVHRLALSPDGGQLWIGTRHFLGKVTRVKDYQTVVIDTRTQARMAESDRSPGWWIWGLDGRGIEIDDANAQVRDISGDGRLGAPWPGAARTSGPAITAFGSERNSLAYVRGALQFVGHRDGDPATLAFRTRPGSNELAGSFETTGSLLHAKPVLDGKFTSPATESIAFRTPPASPRCMFSGMSHSPKTAEQIARIQDDCPNLARLPDGGALLSGSGRATRFAADGTVSWTAKTSIQRPSVRILFTVDGRLFALPADDGILRYHSMATGREVLAVYRNGDRWVESTESGFYRASVGAEGMLGWHVNASDGGVPNFFPLSQFRSRFYRPDVIDRVLDTLDEAEALKQANLAANRRPEAPVSIAQALPPVVELVGESALRTGAAQVTIQVIGRSASDAPVTGWRVRVNGQLVLDEGGDSRGLGRADASAAGGAPAGPGAARRFSVPVPLQDSEVQVMASNRHGTSTPAVVRVTRDAPVTGTPTATTSPAAATAAAPAGFQVQPKLYVLAVGVGDYQHAAINRLQLPAKDARDFAAALQRQKGRLYREVEVKLLTDAQATADAVVDGLDWLKRQVTQHDVGMVFIAGHGVNDPDLGYAYLPANADPDRLRRSSVPMEEFKRTLSRLPGKALFFFDTCHSGNVLGERTRGAVNDISGVINELSSAENGVVVFSSSTGRQLSYEDPAWGNGAFTKALVEGLDGRADYQKNGRITHKMLDLWISERVKELTRGRQSPVTQAPGGVPDFPVALSR